MSETRFQPAPPALTRMLQSSVTVLSVDSPERERAYRYVIQLPAGNRLAIDLGTLSSLAEVLDAGAR
jgi:hypothetical protein